MLSLAIGFLVSLFFSGVIIRVSRLRNLVGGDARSWPCTQFALVLLR